MKKKVYAGLGILALLITVFVLSRDVSSPSIVPTIETLPLEEKTTVILEETSESELSSIPTIPPRQNPSSSTTAFALIEETEERIMIDNAIIDIALEFDNQEEFISYVTEDLNAAEEDLVYYQEEYEILLEEERWDAKYEEYPVATTIWLYLVEEMGLSAECAAGILGNMMVEAGGYTLNINPSAYNSAGYYGICQWGIYSYHSQIQNADLLSQLNYLRETIESEFTYSSVTYNQFVNSTNARDASVYFARGYERCADPYGRQNCADTAYEFFMN